MTESIQPAANPPKPKKPWYKGLWWKIPLFLVGLLGLMNAISSAGPSVKHLPKCDAREAEEMVKDAVKNGPMSKILNLEVLALKNVSTKSSTDEKIVCLATGITNAGDAKLIYDFEWINKERGQYIISVAEDL